MTRTTRRVSVWASDLRRGSLPEVCVKSGRPADRRLTFHFATYGWPAFWLLGPMLAPFVGRRAEGPLPLTKQWHAIFVAFRLVVIGSATLAFVTYWSPVVVPRTWIPGTLIALAAAIGVYLVSHILYAGLRPKGTVHLASEGEPWVELRDVHPNFVAAVAAAAETALHLGPDPLPSPSLDASVVGRHKTGQLSPDRRWYWDGTQWTSVYSADRRWWWDGAAWRATPRSAPRVVAPIAIVIVALVFGGVWVSFFGWPASHAQHCAGTSYQHGSSLPPPAVGFDVPLPFVPAAMTTDGCDWSVVWLVSRQEQALWRFQRDVGSVEGPFSINGVPTAVVSDELNTVWVALESGQVQAIDASTKRVVASVQVGANPVSILAGGGAIWVVNQDSDSVTRIDPKSKRVSGTLSTGARPGRAVLCCGGLLWVANEGDDTISVFDVGSLKQRAVVAVSAPPTGIVDESFLETDPPVWALLADGRIEQIDETKFGVVKSRLVSPKPIGGLGLVHALLVVNEDGTVWVIDDSPKNSFDGDHEVVVGRDAGVVGVAEASGVRGRHETLWIGNGKLKSLSFVIAT